MIISAKTLYLLATAGDPEADSALLDREPGLGIYAQHYRPVYLADGSIGFEATRITRYPVPNAYQAWDILRTA